MKRYRDIKTKDDNAFHKVARKLLQGDYRAACEEAEEAYIAAWDDRNGSKTANIARRAANVVILRWLRSWGVNDWTKADLKGPPPTKPNLDRISGRMQTPDNRQYKSECGLWSAKVRV